MAAASAADAKVLEDFDPLFSAPKKQQTYTSLATAIAASTTDTKPDLTQSAKELLGILFRRSGWTYCPSDPHFAMCAFILPTSYIITFENQQLPTKTSIEHEMFQFPSDTATPDVHPLCLPHVHAVSTRVYDKHDFEWRDNTLTSAALGPGGMSAPKQPEPMNIYPIGISLCTGTARSLTDTLAMSGSPSATQRVKSEPKPFGHLRFGISACFDTQFRSAVFDLKLYVVEKWSGGKTIGFHPQWKGTITESAPANTTTTTTTTTTTATATAAAGGTATAATTKSRGPKEIILDPVHWQ